MCVCNVFCWWFWAGDRQQQMVLICPVCVRHEGSCGREYQGNSTLVEAKTGDIYTGYIYHPPLNGQTIRARGVQRTVGPLEAQKRIQLCDILFYKTFFHKYMLLNVTGSEIS